MIPSFKQFLVEEQKNIYFMFCGANPPNIGNEKSFDALSNSAGKDPYRIYLSRSSKPLDYASKVKCARKMFPRHARSIVINKNIKSALDVVVTLYNEGFKRITMIVETDKMREFDILLKKYNGKKSRYGFYNFENIKIIGIKDNSDEISKKMVGDVKANNSLAFFKNLPKDFNNKEAQVLFNDIRASLGLKEQTSFRNHIKLKKVSELREKYIDGTLFELGEEIVIKESEEIAVVKHLGANYVLIETADGIKYRKWLDAIEKITPKLNGKK